MNKYVNSLNQPDPKRPAACNQLVGCDKCPRRCRPLMTKLPAVRFDPVKDAPQVVQFLHPSGKCWVRAMRLAELKRLAERHGVDYREILEDIRTKYTDKVEIMGDYLVYTWRFFPKDNPPSEK